MVTEGVRTEPPASAAHHHLRKGCWCWLPVPAAGGALGLFPVRLHFGPDLRPLVLPPPPPGEGACEEHMSQT